MNINAIDMLAMKKANQKLGVMKSQPSTVSEPTVSNPEVGTSALEAQAMNNIAFQGVKIPANLTKNMAKLMMMLAVAGGTMVATTSCEEPDGKDIYIENIVTVTVDTEAWTAIFKDMLDQQKITNEQMAKLLALMNQYKDNQDAFQQAVVEYMMNDTAMQQQIYNQLLANGKSQEEANKVLAEIRELMTNGEFEKALNMISEILGTLQDILAQLKTIAEQQVANHKEQMEAQNKANELLYLLYEQGKIDFKQFEELKEIVKNIDKNTSYILANTDKLIAIASDDTKHKELIETIKALDTDGADYAKFEEMFKFYGLTIKNVIEMSADQLEAALKTFMEVYKETEAENAADLSAILDDLNAKVEKLIDQVGTLSNDLSVYNEIYANNWADVMKYLQAFAGDLKDIKGAQNKANTYLKALVEKADQALELLGDIAEDNEGMTLDEFKAYMAERDAAQYKKFVQLMIDMGLDKLAGDVATIKDLVAAIKDKVDAQENYADRLDVIIAKLDGIDFTQEENQELLKKILEAIKNHECNCDCTGDGNHEGIIGDFEDLLG